MMISVLILTKNEEQDLPGCLASVSWSNDIHVFDSYSTDGTVQIALDHGARVTRRQFDNWSAHQNWGLKNLPFRHEWVFYIDADERPTEELVKRMQAAVLFPGDCIAFRNKRRDFFGDRWLRHVIPSPFNIRLFRPDKLHYERLVNPAVIPHGRVGELDGYLDHYPLSKGISHWLAKHNAYSSLEAEQIKRNRLAQAEFSVVRAFTESDRNKRRFHQKELFYRVPLRPFAKFLLLYLVRLGFLDGRPGFTYAALQSIYEYMIVLKTKELDRGSRAPIENMHRESSSLTQLNLP